MEVVSCKVIEDTYCIWSESGRFHMEDREANKRLSLSKSHLHKFVEKISALLQRSLFSKKWLRLLEGDKAGKV